MEQPCTNPNHAIEGAPPCPRCGQQGRSVSPATIESLVIAAAQARLRLLDGFRFCATPACDVAYFHPVTGDIFLHAEVGKTIFQKSTDPKRMVCYCFQHTVSAIQREVRETGTSHIATDITAKCAQGLDDCAHTNPQGSCCLGNVRRVIREATKDNPPPPSDGGGCCCH